MCWLQMPRRRLSNDFESFAPAHNGHSKVKVDEMIQLLQNTDASLAKNAQKGSSDGDSGYFKILDEVAHNPHFWLGPEGGVQAG